MIDRRFDRRAGEPYLRPSHRFTSPADRVDGSAFPGLRIAAQRTPTAAVDARVERRPLSDYDRMFGLDEVAA
ncbi:hypothetical protein [Micromonospora echinaurantiaca]|uniref:hypothetical protein n=1 Tax=Micromonospora echinaurantiaca TaxID=47857 RepID=UPI000B5AE28A|nr:hypothetical protein [Micromonospora echinaurantiaca]